FFLLLVLNFLSFCPRLKILLAENEHYDHVFCLFKTLNVKKKPRKIPTNALNQKKKKMAAATGESSAHLTHNAPITCPFPLPPPGPVFERGGGGGRRGRPRVTRGRGCSPRPIWGFLFYSFFSLFVRLLLLCASGGHHHHPQEPSSQPRRQRSSTRLQSKRGLPSLALTRLCWAHSHCASSERLDVCGGLASR
ncbi:unnamed protein product, partial [Ixodes pacificus]